MTLRPGTFLQDRYEILDRIGSGGMSDVYKALCHKLNRLVAIKVLKEEFSSDVSFVSKFKMEAQAAARLSHPNIVSVYDVVDEGTIHYIVMELVEGITLKNYIQKKGRLDIREAIGIALQVAQGIAAAHEEGIIHRDIKPQNIIIARDGSAKVADFGIARAATSQTLSATAMGSVHYISPEQARGGYSDARSDVYSLGITMYEMVAGRVPFEGDNTVTVALAHLETPITPPGIYNPQIPVSLENIILKCTEKKPEYRYKTMAEMISDLRRALVTPDEDFVKPQPMMDVENSQTLVIEGPELKQIRSGRRLAETPVGPGYARQGAGKRDPGYPSGSDNRREGYEEGKTSYGYPDEDESRGYGYSGRDRSYGAQDGHNRRTNGAQEKRPAPGRKKQDDDINPKLEKLLTVAGVVAAIVIVIVVVFVFSRLGGLFHSGSGSSAEKETETETTTLKETEETVGEKQTEMPDVVGLAEDIARQKLKENGGLDMKIKDYLFSDTVEEGDVISQTPLKGTIVDKYSAVSVVISKGPEHPTINLEELELGELTYDAAKTVLEGRGFKVTAVNQNSDTVREGMVISFSPGTAMEGDTVTLVVSKGPALANPVAVPDITNHTEEVGLEMLADLGLIKGNVTEETSDKVPAGSIIGQSIAPNTQVEAGTAIDYVVSKGTVAETQFKYLASIDKSYPLENLIGPGSGSTQLSVKIQLKQVVNGQETIRELMAPITIKGDQMLPVSFKNIEGAYGVTSGEVEIVNADTGEVINSYPLTFVPVPQS